MGVKEMPTPLKFLPPSLSSPRLREVEMERREERKCSALPPIPLLPLGCVG